MTKTMEAVAVKAYAPLTDELYATIEQKLALGELTLRGACREFNVAMGTLFSRRTRDKQALRERLATTVEGTVQATASKVANGMSTKLEKLMSDWIDTSLHFSKLARIQASGAQTPDALKTASECYWLPAQTVIKAFALGAASDNKDNRANVTVQVGLPSRRDDVIDVAPVLAS